MSGDVPPEGDAGDGQQDASEATPLDSEELRAIFHSVNDAIFVHDGETGEIIDVNETMCEMYGYSRAEARQLTVEDLSSGEEPYTQEHAVEYVRKAAEGDPQVFEWHARDSEGDLFWVEVSMRRAFVDDDLRILVIVRDITDRKRRKRELEELHTRLRLALDETDTGVWEWDLHTDEVVWDETSERLFGYDPGEFPGSFEGFAGRVPDDDPRWVQARGVVEYDDGDPERMLGIQTDVTRHKERERALEATKRSLERSNEKLERVASVVAHDLRNPLSVADGYVELLDEGVDDPEPVDLEGIADRAWSNVDTPDADLENGLSGVVEADPDRLLHVFENLFRNALEHNDPSVVVRTGRLEPTEGTGGGFYVEDDGDGIPEDERDDVFDHGYTTSEVGTGLGLSIVREVVDAHDWAVSVSESADGGARFEVRTDDAGGGS